MPFEIHRPPRVSCVEPWRREVTEMRAANWPCGRIAEWLAEQGIFISAEGVRQFCKVRGIGKPTAPPADRTAPKVRVASSPRPVAPATERSKKFHYKDDGPIEAGRS